MQWRLRMANTNSHWQYVVPADRFAEHLFQRFTHHWDNGPACVRCLPPTKNAPLARGMEFGEKNNDREPTSARDCVGEIAG